MTTALRGRERVTAALAMPPNSSRNFGKQDFVTSSNHGPLNYPILLKNSNFDWLKNLIICDNFGCPMHLCLKTNQKHNKMVKYQFLIRNVQFMATFSSGM